jgi:hypothetical protein
MLVIVLFLTNGTGTSKPILVLAIVILNLK